MGKNNKEEKEKMLSILPELLKGMNEKQRRYTAAKFAINYGYGGISQVSRITGMSRVTISNGIKELEEIEKNGGEEDYTKIRKEGGGRKKATEKNPTLKETIQKIIEPETFGNPEKVVNYTALTLRKIAEKASEITGKKVCYNRVSDILKELGYSKQLNQKNLQVGKPHPDRNEQFEYINDLAKTFLEAGDPVISVDTKKKENIGNFKNNGHEYRKKGEPRKVLDHDFPIEELGKVAPYGIYTLNNNTGFVNLGVDHDTAEFAVESISRWWHTVGKKTFPDAKRLMITCDCGGSNGYKVRLWKLKLQEFAVQNGLQIFVCHYPPGTSKWNKIEHRLFCYISKNWQGIPLIDIQTVVDLIGSTTTSNGLKVICEPDYNSYALSVSVSDEQFNSIRIIHSKFHPEWNYVIY